MEITMKNLLASGELDLRDFLDRVDMLGAMGRTVLISNYGAYYRLVNYLTRYTDCMVGLPLGIPAMAEILEEEYYKDLEGGILEALGRLFKTGVKLYVYPFLNPNGDLVTADNFEVAPNLVHLYRHLLDNGFIESMEGYNPNYLPIKSVGSNGQDSRGRARLGKHGLSGGCQDHQGTPAFRISARTRREELTAASTPLCDARGLFGSITLIWCSHAVDSLHRF